MKTSAAIAVLLGAVSFAASEQEAYDTLLDAQAPTPTGPYAPKPPRTK